MEIYKALFEKSKIKIKMMDKKVQYMSIQNVVFKAKKKLWEKWSELMENKIEISISFCL